MRKSFRALALIVLAIGLLLSGCGQKPASEQQSGVKQQQFELNFSSNYMESHPTVVNAFMPWMKTVEERSGGKVKINFYNPNTLCPVKDVYDNVVAGSVDIGAIFGGYTPGKFPYFGVMDLPLIAPNSEVGSLITWELYQRFPEWREQFKDTKVLWHWASAPYQLHTTKKLVRTLEDLKGMKIIGWSPQILEVIKLLGANPIELTSVDTYLALERGMADGVMCPMAPLRSYKISDAAKYHTIVGISVNPFCMAMNLTKYNSLPPDVQKILEETTGAKMAELCGKSLDQGDLKDTQWMKDNGHTFYVLPAEEKNKWLNAVIPLREKWVKDMEAKGYSKAREILNEAVKLGEQHTRKT